MRSIRRQMFIKYTYKYIISIVNRIVRIENNNENDAKKWNEQSLPWPMVQNLFKVFGEPPDRTIDDSKWRTLENLTNNK